MKKIVFFMLLIIGCISSANDALYKVIKVSDGDTIIVVKDGLENIKANQIKIRLAFIDTMESVRNNRAKKISKTCNINLEEIITLGKYSKEYLKNLILDKKINIIFYGKDDLDKREVGEIFFIGDYESINIKMVLHGKAIPYYKYIKKYNEDIEYYKWLVTTGSSKNENLITNTCINRLLE